MSKNDFDDLEKRAKALTRDYLASPNGLRGDTVDRAKGKGGSMAMGEFVDDTVDWFRHDGIWKLLPEEVQERSDLRDRVINATGGMLDDAKTLGLDDFVLGGKGTSPDMMLKKDFRSMDSQAIFRTLKRQRKLR